MSYEGYGQHICTSGHRFDADCYDEAKCHCGAPSAWSKAVDDTNGDVHGYIKPEDFQKLVITEAVVQRCNLGHNHVISETTYRLPKEGELQLYYRTDKGEYAPIMRHKDDCKFWKDICVCNPSFETARV